MRDANLETAARLPDYARESNLVRRFAREMWDHLWPWSGAAARSPAALRALSYGVAVVVSVAWVMAAGGRVGSGATLGWWLGWSVTEVLVRLDAKPYVKDGPWWGQHYRPAAAMDMICYVAFKNLLIGAGCYLLLSASGALDVLRQWAATAHLPG